MGKGFSEWKKYTAYISSVSALDTLGVWTWRNYTGDIETNSIIRQRAFVHILKLSLSQSILPTEPKFASVLSFYKTNDPIHFDNYRPAPLLSLMSIVYTNMHSRLI